ncbi:DUF3370 domain-containing protein [Thermosynechococcaceae cyanobacterium BACA0444]|uniref:DUF3370 domain-containing protein n=1 Tax=Pseudocalidococcus azoricus BACA0444 TaxID=2918990 RepID=A0AAE4FWX1_9CYAN|nr:DUF3370 domain-containing protein [Pseudocalidococcus azoricus]MDS3862465.1 DUF3370 domain-containing protein [Pseudocalidococcus azoricus BACA0444]
MFRTLPTLVSFMLAQAPAIPPAEMIRPDDVRPLPGSLDMVPVFNSNSPEKIQQEGILLSTLNPAGKQNPAAHLNFSFNDRFDIFAHHVTKAAPVPAPQVMYLGILVENPNKTPVRILVLQANTRLTTHAPFVNLPTQVLDQRNRVFAGPGSRASGDFLRRERDGIFPESYVIPPQSSQMLVVLPIPATALNGRSLLMRLFSNGRVNLASLALWEKTGPEKVPTLKDWQQLAQTGQLSIPRDRTPTPPTQTSGQFIYGRVAGVSRGSQWRATVTDRPEIPYLTIPAENQAISYVINTLDRGTLGTQQIQSAPMLVRYPDTAYRSHGNYGVLYELTLPLKNPTIQAQQVAIRFQTPIKEDQLSQAGLRYLQTPANQIFFRGPVRLEYEENGTTQVKYFHLVQRRGQMGEPLLTLDLPPQTQRTVKVELVYPPDATPPQVLTVETTLNPAPPQSK